MWSHNGRELFYREGDAMMVVGVQHDPFRASPPRKLFDLPGELYGLDPYVADYDAAPDGASSRFAGTPLPRSTWC